MRITSLVTLPRINSSCFPSRDQAKLKIRSEVKFVSWRGGPPDSGCSQRLEAPFLVSPYCRALPEGDQARPRVPERHLAYEMHGAARGRNHRNFRYGNRAAFLVGEGELGPVGRDLK